MGGVRRKSLHLGERSFEPLDLSAFNRELNELLMTFLLAEPLTLLAVISGGYFLASRADACDD